MRRRLLALGAALVAMALVATLPAAVGGSTRTILKVQVMVGLPNAYTGTKVLVRGVPGGGVPWVIGSARAELSQGGSLEVEVKHLVIDPNDPVAISRGLAGTNPSPVFRALVSCLTADGGMQNVLSDPFPATTGSGPGAGNAEADDLQLTLPDPCIAPILFVTSGGGAWFATTGG
jgi:hypothetical protein